MSLLLERDTALATLQACAERSARTRGHIVLLAGEAGVGKSSLLEAFACTLPAQRTVAWGRCDDLFTPRQLGPFYDLAPVLGDPVQAALTQARGAAPVDLFARVLAAISRLPAGSTLLFEDVHWADHASLDLLNFIARRLAALRVLLVLSYRDAEVGPGHPLTLLLGALPAALTTRLQLQPLSRAAVQQLAHQHGRDGEALYRATGGNPFFLSEIVAQAATAGDGLPGSVRDAVLARLLRISEAERQLLQALSVAPDPVSPPVLQRLCGAQGPALAQACEARGLLLRDADGKLRFRHELARVATLEALPPLAQLQHHRRLLDVYLGMGDEVPPNRLVHHAAALNDAACLLQHAPRAALQAAALGAHNEAAAHLATALRHVHAAPPEQAATLFQDWAYEAGLLQVNDAVIGARRQAVQRWQALGRMDRVGDNLRWLWRLHWYRGEIDQAEAAAQQSVATLEAIPPSAELAQAYALRSHVHLLKGRRADAIQWGRQALEMATHFADTDTRVQALVTVGTAQAFGGDDAGCAVLEEALQCALAHGLHEQAARVYTNWSEYSIVVRRWAVAERLVLEGLAFDIKHNLESWTGYLAGRHAQLRLEQGRLAEAVTLARGALDLPGRTLLMRLPALTVLAVARSRQGADDARALLNQALADALAMREQQRLTPVRLGFIEHAYLQGDPALAREHVQALMDFGVHLLRPWDAGALRVWAARLGVPWGGVGGQSDGGTNLHPGDSTHVRSDADLPTTTAQALELAGDSAAAAAHLQAVGAPFDAALCQLVAATQTVGINTAAINTAAKAVQRLHLQAALAGFDALGALAGARAVQRVAAQQGQPLQAPQPRRGPYKAARNHPLGLTAKEVQVLALLADGASNAEIAERLSRSQRTVEHHVSAVLGKLNASNRLEAVLRALAEPWIIQSTAAAG